MIELRQFRPFWGLPDASPFCMKAETYLCASAASPTRWLPIGPRSLDMGLYAFLANILDQPHGNPLQAHARTLANLAGYCARMKALCWLGRPD
jgi:hypothetical protein